MNERKKERKPTSMTPQYMYSKTEINQYKYPLVVVTGKVLVYADHKLFAKWLAFSKMLLQMICLSL